MKFLVAAGLLFGALAGGVEPASASTIRFTYDQEAPRASTYLTPVLQGPTTFIGGFGGTATGFIDVERAGGIDTATNWSFALVAPRGTAPTYLATDAFTEQLVHMHTLTTANSTVQRVLSGPGAGRQRIRGDFFGLINNDTSGTLQQLRITLELEDVAGLGPDGSVGYQLHDAYFSCILGDTACTALFRDDVMIWRGAAGNPLTVGAPPAANAPAVPLPASLPLLLAGVLAMLGLTRARASRA